VAFWLLDCSLYSHFIVCFSSDCSRTETGFQDFISKYPFLYMVQQAVLWAMSVFDSCQFSNTQTFERNKNWIKIMIVIVIAHCNCTGPCSSTVFIFLEIHCRWSSSSPHEAGLGKLQYFFWMDKVLSVVKTCTSLTANPRTCELNQSSRFFEWVHTFQWAEVHFSCVHPNSKWYNRYQSSMSTNEDGNLYLHCSPVAQHVLVIP